MKAFFRRTRPGDASRAEPSRVWMGSLQPRSGASGERRGDQHHPLPQPNTRYWPFILATAMVSATVLLLEMTFTRIFSLFLNYHYVFVILAVALLGLGLGATLCTVTRHPWLWLSRQPSARMLWQVCCISGGILIVVTILLTQTALASTLPAAFALALLPFLGAGVFLALAFTIEAAHSRELYAADLLGAGIGSLASLPALRWLGAEHTLMLAALGFLVLAVFLVLTTDRSRWLMPVLICLLAGSLLGVTMTFGSLTIKPTALRYSHKHLGHILRNAPHARIVDARWSALARTDVIEMSRQGMHQYVAFTDGGAATPFVSLPTTPAEWAQFDRAVGLFPYRTSPRERVLIIGAGGGFDVVLALRGAAQAITAVEVNPDILRAVERFIPPARNIYRQPTVQVISGDGRQVVRQSRQLYDLIVLPQVYTGAAQRPGGALVENYVLTVEAFQDYLAHLTPQGRLVVHVHDAVEALKTVFMGVEALARRGLPRSAALHHLLILQDTASPPGAPLPIDTPLIILKNTPYTPSESHQQATLAQTMQLTPLFIPHMAAASPFEGLLQHTAEVAMSLQAMGAIWWPPTDNRPFFYETYTGLPSVSWVVRATLLLLLGLHVWHFIRQRRMEGRIPRSTAWLPFLAATGYAALLVQIALLQRYLVVLGSPSLTVVALLFPLLFFGGVSSLASTLLRDATLRRVLPWSCLALGVLLGLYLVTFPAVRDLLANQSVPVRVLSTMILLAPLGLLMGLPFPSALRLLSPLAETIVPWAWGVNTVACVLGSVVALNLAVSFGLQMVILLAALVYGLAGYWVHRVLRRDIQRPMLSL